jgi:uncharacterized protein
MRRLTEALRAGLMRALLGPIRLYQRAISPLFPRRCKYEPTCSAYAIEAVRVYGPLRGSLKAGWRLLRCNPWSHGGHDPVVPATGVDRSLPRSGAEA